MTFTPLRFSVLFFILLACGQNAGAAISTAYIKAEKQVQINTDKSTAFQKSATSVRPPTKKEKKKWRLGKWLKNKFAKAENETRKSKYGKIAWLIFIGGFALLLIYPVLGFTSFGASLFFAVYGISKDEKKDTAISALIAQILIGALIFGFIMALRNIED